MFHVCAKACDLWQMDSVIIRGLRLHAKHGCHKEERFTGGYFEADLEIFTDNTNAAKTDQIGDAIDYVTVMEIAQRVFEKPQNLIERVAVLLGQDILNAFKSATRVDVEIKKLAPPVRYQLEYVSVKTSIERTENN